MKLDDFNFLFLIFSSFIAFIYIKNEAIRKGLLLGVSFTFVFSFYDTAQQLIPLVCFLSTVVCAIWYVAFRPSKFSLAVSLIAVVGLFLMLKQYIPIIKFQSLSLITVGLSYILFRAIPLLIDIKEHTINKNELSFFNVLLYMICFLTFLTGPIQNYTEFRVQVDHNLFNYQPRFEHVLKMLPRLVLGYFKLICAAPFFYQIYELCSVYSDKSALNLAIAALSFLAYVYLNFSGTMDILISIGTLFGFELPENFNKPYLAKNFLDIWNRWHITLSQTFKIYVFNPLIRQLMAWNLFNQRPILAGVAAYFFTFTILGIWHGNSSAFFLFGLMLATGVSINKIVEQSMLNHPNSFDNKINQYPLYSTFKTGIAVAYFSIISVAAWPVVQNASQVFSVFNTTKHVVEAWLLVIIIFAFFSHTAQNVYKLLNDKSHHYLKPVMQGIMLVCIVAKEILGQQEFSSLIFYQNF
jgi:alginate O-acetyltransferase complex protein AlgI